MIFRKPKSDEPSIVSIYPHFSKQLGAHHSGIVVLQSWVNKPIISRCIAGNTPLKGCTGPGIVTSDVEKLCEEKWAQNLTDDLKPLLHGLKLNPPVNSFANKDEFFAALLADSLACTSVETHMLSEPPEKLGDAATKYFDGVHNAITSGVFRTFRRIATVQSKEKAQWVLKTLLNLRCAEAFSLAIQYPETQYPMTSFHIASCPNRDVVFVWSLMIPGTIGTGFSVESRDVASAMRQGFEQEFFASVKLKSGPTMCWEEIEFLVDKFRLKDHPDYKALLKTKLT